MIIEPLVLIFFAICVIFIFIILKMAKELIINTILGLIILFFVNFLFHLHIRYTIWTILVCAIGGIPGSILVILLHLLKIAF